MQLIRNVSTLSLGFLLVVACSDSDADSSKPSAAKKSSQDADASSPRDAEADGGGSGDSASEKKLTLDLTLGSATAATGGAGGAGGAAGAAGGGGMGGAAASDAPLTKLTITARDGKMPVITDLWLYTLEDGGPKPLTKFTASTARKSARLMLPATIDGKPSGLTPADTGDANGLMTATSRGTMSQGAFVSSLTGTVSVTLEAAPKQPILVVAAVEDQRYAGAAAINPDGSDASVPSGMGEPETHTLRSFEHDVKPILLQQCSSCHNPQGPLNARFYLLTGTRDELVNDNYGLTESADRCHTANPDEGQALDACIAAITAAQYLVEPGAPAVSNLLTRARPDEDAASSMLGLAWYGSKGARYSASYGDRRMPSTTISTDEADWKNAATSFDMKPSDYQILFDWVAQGAKP